MWIFLKGRCDSISDNKSQMNQKDENYDDIFLKEMCETFNNKSPNKLEINKFNLPVEHYFNKVLKKKNTILSNFSKVMREDIEIEKDVQFDIPYFT